MQGVDSFTLCQIQQGIVFPSQFRKGGLVGFRTKGYIGPIPFQMA